MRDAGCLLTAALLFALGCGGGGGSPLPTVGDATPPPRPVDAAPATPDTAPPPATVDAATPPADAAVPVDIPICNPLVDLSTPVIPEPRAEARPAALTPAGGQIQDGTYLVTAFVVFEAAPQQMEVYRMGSVQTTAVFSAGATRLELVGNIMSPLFPAIPLSRVASVAVAGASLTTTEECGPASGAIHRDQFTATATQIFWFPAELPNTMITLTRR